MQALESRKAHGQGLSSVVVLFALVCSRASSYHVALLVAERDGNGLVGTCHAVAVVDGERDLHRAAGSICGHVVGGDDVVGYKDLGCGDEIDVAVDARKMPHVLSLEIGTVAPAIDAHGELVDVVCRAARPDAAVGLLLQGCGDIKFRVGIGSLRVADIVAIDPNGSGTIDAIEMEEDALVAPRLVERELAAVEARGIVVLLVGLALAGHGLWRIVLEGIADVGIDRSSVARHLPGERHADGLPLAGHIVGRLFEVLGIELAGCGSACCALDIAEAPLLAVLAAVEASHQRARLVRGKPRSVVVGSVGTELRCGGIGQEGGMGSLLVVLKLLWVAGPGGDVVCLAHIDIVYQAHALADGMAADFPLGATYLDGGRPGGEQGRDGRAGSLLQYAVDIEAILGQMDGEELRVVIKLHV